MLDMNLRGLILSAPILFPHLSQPLISAVRARIKSHPKEVNEQDILGNTPCRLAAAIGNIRLLEILVLDGKGDLSFINVESKSTISIKDPSAIMQLQLEVKRRAESNGNHLHDILGNRKKFISSLKFESAVRERVLKFPHEVNEKTYLNRNAIHWCAYYKHLHLIPLIKELYPDAQMNEKDYNNHVPTDLIAKRSNRSVNKQLISPLRRDTITSRDGREPKAESKKQPLVVPRLGEPPQRKAIQKTLSKGSNSIDEIYVLAKRLRDLSLDDASPKKIYLGPLLKALQEQHAHFLICCLEQGYRLSELEEVLNCSTIAYAFRESMGNTFSSLVTYGESLRAHQFLRMEPATIELLKSERHREIITLTQNNILEKISWIKVQQAQINLIKSSSEFDDLISDINLKSNMPSTDSVSLSNEAIDRIAHSVQLPAALFRELNQICSDDENDFAGDNARFFNTEELACKIAALNTQYKAIEIMSGLLKLKNELGARQQLLIIFTLKEVLVKSVLLTDYELQIISSIILPGFFKNGENKELHSLLNQLLHYRLQTQEVMIDNYHYVESLVRQNIPTIGLREFRNLILFPNDTNKEQPKYVAQVLKAYSLVLFQDLQLKELANPSSKGPLKERIAPSVCAIENYFNSLSNAVAHQVLQQEDVRSRANYVTFYITIAYELIASDIPDYNSAMAIYSALNIAPISRLTATHALLNKKTQNLLDIVSATLTQEKNFKMIRSSLASNPCAIPYIGMITSDLTFALENKKESDRNIIKGKVMRQLEEIKRSLSLLHLPIESNVGHFLREAQVVSDDKLYERSLILEPKPVSLNCPINVRDMRKRLQLLKQKGAGLKVIKDEPLFEKDALVALTTYLKDNYLDNKISINVFSELVNLANQIVYPDVQYTVNPLHFGLIKHSHYRMLLQYQHIRTTKGLDMDTNQEPKKEVFKRPDNH